MLIGYARVSTLDQNLDLQKKSLLEAGCEKIYEDAASGTASDRPGLNLLLEVLREGDCLVVWKLDRLGRSLKRLIELVETLAERGINFRSLTDSIDTATPSGRFFFHLMASLAEMERDLIVERTRAGLEAARAKGRVGGRRRVMTAGKVEAGRRLLAAGMTAKEAAASLGVSLPTFYRWLPASS